MTWWSLVPTAQRPSTLTRDVQPTTSGGPHGGSQVGEDFGRCVHQGRTLAPAHRMSSRLSSQHGPWLGGEHWVAVFLEDLRWAEYSDYYGTALLESIYQWLRGRATGIYVMVRKCYRAPSQDSVDSTALRPRRNEKTPCYESLARNISHHRWCQLCLELQLPRPRASPRRIPTKITHRLCCQHWSHQIRTQMPLRRVWSNKSLSPWTLFQRNSKRKSVYL